MKTIIAILALISSTTFAQTIITQSGSVITPGGSYQVSTPNIGSTTYITQTAGSQTKSSNYNQIVPAVPVTVNPITGIGQVITPNGSYMVQQIGSTTSVIQTSKSR